MACNHEAYDEPFGYKAVVTRCGKCGEVIWAYPAKSRIDWVWVGLLLILLLIWGSLLAWTLWQWLGERA